MKLKNRRLQLSRETLHLLQDAELGDVAGGSTRTLNTFCGTCNCPTTSVILCCQPYTTTIA